MSQAVLGELQRNFPEAVIDTHEHCGDETIILRPEGLIPMTTFLRERLGFDMLLDICGNDHPDKEQRFEAIYHFLRTGHSASRTRKWKRIRLKIPVGENEHIPSLCEQYKSANWLERETWDLFGIPFEGHPDLRRLLTHWKFEGHPLRKDYDKEKRQHLDESAPNDWFRVRAGVLEKGGETILANIGPAHPLTKGMFRMVTELDGEFIRDADLEIGYLHRGMEKEAEAHTWGMVLPYAERLNDHSAQINTSAYALAVEKLAGIEVPERAQWLRMFMAEMSRIMDHCLCLGNTLADMGAMTNFWYFFKIREACSNILDNFTGARLTGNCDRIGGFAWDVYDGFEEDAKELAPIIADYLGDAEELILTNRIFLDRSIGVGCITRKDAISYGLTGPVARAAGVQYDVRKIMPYHLYDQVDFEIVVGVRGDVHERVMVRLEEIRQSLRIMEQILVYLRKTRGTPILADVRDITLPTKRKAYTSMEAMIRHYNVVTCGERIPDGEAYGYVEGANGELGFYLVSDGAGHPQRCHVRSPSLANLQAFVSMVRGSQLADAVATFGSLNIVSGELDR